MQHDHVLKKLNFDFLTPSPTVVGGGEGSVGKIFATMLLHFLIPFNLVLFVCLFDLILYVASTIFQLNRDGSSWVEPVLS